ncbi:unnamed protein product [Mortierella alpina]
MVSSTITSAEFVECCHRREEHQCEEDASGNSAKCSKYCKFHRSLATRRDNEKRGVSEWITGSKAKPKVNDLIEGKYHHESKARHYAKKNEALRAQIEDLQRANVDLQSRVDKQAKSKIKLKKTNSDLRARAKKLAKAKEPLSATDDVVTDLVTDLINRLSLSVIRHILEDDDNDSPPAKLPPSSSSDENEP